VFATAWSRWAVLFSYGPLHCCRANSPYGQTNECGHFVFLLLFPCNERIITADETVASRRARVWYTPGLHILSPALYCPVNDACFPTRRLFHTWRGTESFAADCLSSTLSLALLSQGSFLRGPLVVRIFCLLSDKGPYHSTNRSVGRSVNPLAPLVVMKKGCTSMGRERANFVAVDLSESTKNGAPNIGFHKSRPCDFPPQDRKKADEKANARKTQRRLDDVDWTQAGASKTASVFLPKPIVVLTTTALLLVGAI
jgi:hypothetical protein